MQSKEEQIKAMANILCESCSEQECAYGCMVLHKPCQGVIRHSEHLYEHNCRVIDKSKVVKRYNEYLGVDEWAIEREYVATKFCPFKTEEEAQAALKKLKEKENEELL